VLATVAVLGVGLALIIRLDGEESSPPRLGATLSVAEALGATSADGFERALAPRPLAFPADHGPHPTFRTVVVLDRTFAPRWGRPALRIPADVLSHGARPGGGGAAIGLGHARRVHGTPRADRRGCGPVPRA
jgi:hypothetical protein